MCNGFVTIGGMIDVITDRQAADNLAFNVRRLCAKHGVSLRALAVAIGETPMRMSNISRGKYVADIAVAARIAEHFETTVDLLLKPSEEKSLVAS